MTETQLFKLTYDPAQGLFRLDIGDTATTLTAQAVQRLIGDLRAHPAGQRVTLAYSRNRAWVIPAEQRLRILEYLELVWDSYCRWKALSEN